jgi:hypothetical protein
MSGEGVTPLVSEAQELTFRLCEYLAQIAWLRYRLTLPARRFTILAIDACIDNSDIRLERN